MGGSLRRPKGVVPRPARLLLLVAVMLILGASSPARHTARCHTVWGVARVCNAQAATAKPADRFAKHLLAFWNVSEGAHGFPADIARCAPYGIGRDGLRVYACEWRVWWKTVRRYRCLYAVLDTRWNQYEAQWIRCRGVFAPKAGAA